MTGDSQTRLTTLVKTGGCGSKMGPADLRVALSGIPQSVKHGPEFVFGSGAGDDAAVYRINDETAIVQTVDFFAPIVDDPYDFGVIAAANALSDCYALGARPITAMNISLFPQVLGPDVVRQILAGGASKIEEAGALLVGGHTVASSEPLYGLSVTGVVHPKKFVPNSGAKPGQSIIVTKRLGVGIVANALRSEKTRESVPEALRDEALRSMKTLNRIASELMVELGATACTDVTGFSFLGHAHNMALASGVEFEVDAGKMPLLTGVYDFAVSSAGGACKRNQAWLGDFVTKSPEVDEAQMNVLFDAQTSGPLLIVMDDDSAQRYVSEFEKRSGSPAWIVGKVVNGRPGAIRVSQ